MLGVIGHLSVDVVDEGLPRIGGGPWHAARALRAVRPDAVLYAKCGEAQRERFEGELANGAGVAAQVSVGGETTAFSMTYDENGVRSMTVDAVGEPWRASEPTLRFDDVDWLQVAPLLRSDFDAATLAELARGRRILLDGQGLVRVPRPGPLVLDGDFDREMLRHVAILKLAEEEARAIIGAADLETLASLGVPEVVVTFGLAGSLVLAGGTATRVPADPVHVDPTGAGDAFAAAYLAARSAGAAAVEAARQASALVGALLRGSDP
jgi:sugar/nucleoside kinase (ribokinase family)